MSRTPRRSTRNLAASIAVLCLLSQVMVYAHLALVRHETCPEHGELIERGSDGPAALVPGSQLSAQLSAQPSARILAAGQDRDEHEHCRFCLQRREHSASVFRCELRAELPGAGQIYQPFSESLRGPGIALFRLAPKQSPPA